MASGKPKFLGKTDIPLKVTKPGYTVKTKDIVFIGSHTWKGKVKPDEPESPRTPLTNLPAVNLNYSLDRRVTGTSPPSSNIGVNYERVASPPPVAPRPLSPHDETTLTRVGGASPMPQPQSGGKVPPAPPPPPLSPSATNAGAGFNGVLHGAVPPSPPYTPPATIIDPTLTKDGFQWPHKKEEAPMPSSKHRDSRVQFAEEAKVVTENDQIYTRVLARDPSKPRKKYIEPDVFPSKGKCSDKKKKQRKKTWRNYVYIYDENSGVGLHGPPSPPESPQDGSELGITPFSLKTNENNYSCTNVDTDNVSKAVDVTHVHTLEKDDSKPASAPLDPNTSVTYVSTESLASKGEIYCLFWF